MHIVILNTQFHAEAAALDLISAITCAGNPECGFRSPDAVTGLGLSLWATTKTTSKRHAESRVKVVRARRIWGTLKTSSPGAVSATISKLISTRVALKIKRKTKRLANKTVWWFVVHGSKGDLAKIEQAWDKVQSQTLWTLQDC